MLAIPLNNEQPALPPDWLSNTRFWVVDTCAICRLLLALVNARVIRANMRNVLPTARYQKRQAVVRAAGLKEFDRLSSPRLVSIYRGRIQMFSLDIRFSYLVFPPASPKLGKERRR